MTYTKHHPKKYYGVKLRDPRGTHDDLAVEVFKKLVADLFVNFKYVKLGFKEFS